MVAGKRTRINGMFNCYVKVLKTVCGKSGNKIIRRLKLA